VNSLFARLREERGWGLVSSVLVVGILISLSLPLLSLVDNQQRQSAQERKSESSFNLAEAALDASVFVLGKDWPAHPSGVYPETCTPVSTDPSCPSTELLTSSYTGGDFTNRNWTIQVRDDDILAGEYYDPADVPDNLRWDSNRNGKLWVRADAHAAEGNRTIVALVKRIDRTVPFPRNAITAGWFQTSNNGNKVIVDTKGDTAQPAPVAVRCNQPNPSPCLDYRPTQVAPDTTETGYASETTLPPEIIESFREKARALDTYYPSGCPSSLTGELIFVESGDCSYTGSGAANSASVPGMLIIGDGTLQFGGGMTYYGLVYGLNLQGSTGEIVRIHGAATVVGSVLTDGGGGVTVGSSGSNVVYADAIFPRITSFSSAAPVQGSWRELPAS
jgi:type II secretory pathway pseudopilin PulG